MTYKDALENRKNARKLAQHQQEQPAKPASRKRDLLAHLVAPGLFFPPKWIGVVARTEGLLKLQ